VVLPLRTSTIEEVLALVVWVQQRHHTVSLAHRKRRVLESYMKRHYRDKLINLVYRAKCPDEEMKCVPSPPGVLQGFGQRLARLIQ
jgi:hypothetical protein